MPARAAPQPLSVSARTFRAELSQVREARGYLARAMGGSPARDDAVACLSELATNAVVHSRSGRGGSFTVEVSRGAGRWRVAVADEGGRWQHQPNGDGASGRGLAVVTGLAARWRIDGGSLGRVAWFEIAD
jgi:anti-sigma regulatory factor (Ser/Thr protein kinase)